MTYTIEIDEGLSPALAYAALADLLACAERRNEAVEALRIAHDLAEPGTPEAQDLAARLDWLAPA